MQPVSILVAPAPVVPTRSRQVAGLDSPFEIIFVCRFAWLRNAAAPSTQVCCFNPRRSYFTRHTPLIIRAKQLLVFRLLHVYMGGYRALRGRGFDVAIGVLLDGLMLSPSTSTTVVMLHDGLHDGLSFLRGLPTDECSQRGRIWVGRAYLDMKSLRPLTQDDIDDRVFVLIS